MVKKDKKLKLKFAKPSRATVVIRVQEPLEKAEIERSRFFNMGVENESNLFLR